MRSYVLASASLLKLPDHVMKVLFSCVPDVTGYTRMVETTEEYESSGFEVMTEYVMKWSIDYRYRSAADSFARITLTECSSCLTSSSVPSLKVHLTISVSSEVPLTNSLLSSLDQNLLKSWSLIRCQTSLKDASMTADSLTEVDVGMLPDMLIWVV
jgi:hypothetical protein